MLLPLLGQLRVGRPTGRARTRPEAVLGGKAYSSRPIRAHLRARGIKAVIPEPADQPRPPPASWFPRRTPRRPRRGDLQGAERDRAPVRPPQAVTGTDNQV